MKKNVSSGPPGWALKFLRWFCRKDLLEEIEGDLQESYEYYLEEMSPAKARRQYTREVLGLFRPAIMRPLFSDEFYINTSMITNYLKVALRQIQRHKLFSGLNIIGLSASMAVCLLIIMILADQFSYDQFQENKDTLYRIVSDQQTDELYLRARSTMSPMPLAAHLKENYPWVKETIRIAKTGGDATFGDKKIPLQGLWTDQSFIDVFSFDWVEGDGPNALRDPYSIVITEGTRELIFKEENAIGKIISFGEDRNFVVKGIIADPPQRSHIQFEYLLSFSTIHALKTEGRAPLDPDSWSNIYSGFLYFQLDDQKYEADLRVALDAIAKEKSSQDANFEYLFSFQPFTRIAPGDIDKENPLGHEIPRIIFYILAGLGGLILLLACFNYTNLSIARSLKRAKEVGIRKVNGAGRGQIIAQFLVEAVMISLIALLASIFLLEFLLRGFYNLNPFIVNFFNLPQTAGIYLIFLGFSILVGMLAGIFPAIHLSSFRPAETLKKLYNLKMFSFLGLRKALLVIQFSFSILFIISTLVILAQHRKLTHTNLGFRTENIVNVSLQGVDYAHFEQRASQLSEVLGISGSAINPSSGVNMGIQFRRVEQNEYVHLDYNIVCGNYLENLDMKVVAGRAFPQQELQDHERFVMLNEKAVISLGFENPRDAVGKQVEFRESISDSTAKALTVIGVVEDFHYLSPAFAGSRIGPFCLRYVPSRVGFANVRITGNNVPGTIESLKEVWEEFDQTHAMQYMFFDEKIARTYTMLTSSSRILGLIGTLAIIIACLGLLGMVTYSVESRVREIGIRKVLGASERQLIWNLSKGFLLLLGIAIVIAVPVSWILNQMWLENYTIRIEMGPGIIVLGILIILSLSLLAIVSQTWLAARTNPAKTLRTE